MKQSEVTNALRVANMEEPASLSEKTKKDWVKELRSGRWNQANRWLDDRKGGRCCLGVLCEIKKVENWRFHAALAEPYSGKWKSFAPDGFGLSIRVHDILTKLNDDGATFKQIANAIEEVL